MLFLLEIKNQKAIDVEDVIIENLLRNERYIHTYKKISIDDFYEIETDELGNIIEKRLYDKTHFPKEYEDAIPIGNIPFIDAWLKIFKGIDNQNPIEIPPILRTEEFLKRKYGIFKKEDIPTHGRYFIKDASQLKVFSFEGELEFFFYDGIWDKKEEGDNALHLDPTHLYQVSEIVNILSEYRVYIIGGEIQAIEHYNGNPTILPDVDLIKKANLLYSSQKDYPKSYSLDVMVTPRGTSIIEIHNFTSLGLYSTVWGSNLLYAYRDGIDYLIKHNTKQIESNNF